MTDQDADELYKGIMEYLKQHHMAEIFNHIEEQVVEGKVVEEAVQTFREQPDTVQSALPMFGSGTNHLKPSGKGQFSTIVPYTSKERLEIVVNVIEQTLFTPLKVQEYLETSFVERYSLQRVDFVSPTQETLVSISRQNHPFFTQESDLNYLKKLLDQLRGEF